LGIAASWITVTGLDRAEFLERLGLIETGETLDVSDDWFPRDPLCAGGVATLYDGRQIFISRYADLAAPEVAQRVSIGTNLVMCSMEEHVMHSEAYSYTDGKLDWLIRHDCNRSDDDPEIMTEGRPPPTLAAALAAADEGRRAHPTTDYHFDVPIEVVGPLAGYRADPNSADESAFDQVVSIVRHLKQPEPAFHKIAGRWTVGWLALFFSLFVLNHCASGIQAARLAFARHLP
jgi:hypothetical protein